MSTSGQEVVAILDNAEKLFWSDLGLMARRGNVFNVRDAAISLALIQALQTSLGGTSASGAVLATRLLGECLTCCLIQLNPNIIKICLLLSLCGGRCSR